MNCTETTKRCGRGANGEWRTGPTLRVQGSGFRVQGLVFRVVEGLEGVYSERVMRRMNQRSVRRPSPIALTDYSQLDMLAFLYKPDNFRAGKSPG